VGFDIVQNLSMGDIRTYIKIFDTVVDNTKQMYPPMTKEVKQILKANGFRWDGKVFKSWVLDDINDITDRDLECLKWIIEKIYLGRTYCKLGMEIWVSEDGALSLKESVLDNVIKKYENERKKKPDEKKQEEDMAQAIVEKREVEKKLELKHIVTIKQPDALSFEEKYRKLSPEDKKKLEEKYNFKR
jgi:hypothetical protein